MSYLLSCFTNSYGRFGVEACVEQVAAAGLQHVELAIKTDGIASIFGETPMLTDASGPQDVERVRQRLDEHSIRLSSCNITSGNPLQDAVVLATEKKLKLAADLGVTLVVAGAGEVETPQQRVTLLSHLRRLGDAAGQLGITYCFEVHPGICVNAKGMQQTMEELDHPHLRLNFDTGNILFYNEGANVIDELLQVREWVQHVHLKDHNGISGDWHFTACGDGGAVDFTAVRETLDNVGFTGPYSLEIEGIQGEPPLTLAATHERVARSVEHLRNCGYLDKSGNV